MREKKGVEVEKREKEKKKKHELGRDRTCNPQIRSLMRFHCATSPFEEEVKKEYKKVRARG